ncbi:MAG: GNAT family N-acetyltransferase [Paludibacter sp.]
MFEIKRYSVEQKNAWDVFVENSINGTFLFKRDYMEYHSERFQDNSLMIYRKGMLYALLPANRAGNVLYSHQGLTYGGFILSSKTTVLEILDVFEHVNNFLKSEGVREVIYKAMPHIYQLMPAQEDLYALFRCGAELIGRNISSTIYQRNKIKFVESRKSGIRKAINNSLIVKESLDFEAFWKILDDNLINKYGIKPVHTIQEIEYLHNKFPENIKLYLVSKEGIPLGGTVVYITKQVLHTQYISSNLAGKKFGALDLLFDKLINEIYCKIPIFDFGQSTEQYGNILNDALIFQKEGFGGRGIMYDIYKYNV